MGGTIDRRPCCASEPRLLGSGTVAGLALDLGAARQAPLPTMRKAAGVGIDPFAHPAELAFARLLSYYRIRWVYEPTTFALGRNAAGDPAACFTPDFYLPDHRLYIELTTMRQRLVTRKNRKLRLLRERYPNVRIKLLYRRDLERLIDAYSPPAAPRPPSQLGPVLLSEAAIGGRIDQLAAAVAADLALSGNRGGGPPLLLGVGAGSDRTAEALTAGLLARGVRVERDRVDLSRYLIDRGGPAVRIGRPPAAAIAGRRVIVVEDVVSTGLSLAFLMGWLRRRGAAEVASCALLDRRSARLIDVPIRYAGFEAPDAPLGGWGLRLHRQFQDLPFIATIEPGD